MVQTSSKSGPGILKSSPFTSLRLGTAAMPQMSAPKIEARDVDRHLAIDQLEDGRVTLVDLEASEPAPSSPSR